MWEKHQVSPLVFFETKQTEMKSSTATISEHFAKKMHFEAFWTGSMEKECLIEKYFEPHEPDSVSIKCAESTG